MRSARRNFAGFTIVEVLVVLAIILVLAGLILATSSYVHNKGARSRAEAEIAAMSAALENYKADNGVYPSGATTTDTLSSKVINFADYQPASLVLYHALSGDTVGDRGIEGPSYFSFKPNQLSPPDQNLAVTYIKDPFGNSYGYSTVYKTDPAKGYNPTFDLWSTAGSTDASSTPNPAGWVKNW